MATTVRAGRPTRYVIEYTNRLRWEESHRVPGHPPDPDEFRDWLDVRTLREARKEAKRLLEWWPFAQPVIHYRYKIMKNGDYWMEEVWP